MSLFLMGNNKKKSLSVVVLGVVILTFSAVCLQNVNGFSVGFYALTCPAAELIVRNTVRTAASDDSNVPGKLLRLLFHDCFVEGCDGSVLIAGDETERSDPANASLGGFEVIEAAKSTLETFCPGTVSCADILALAARDAVVMTGGPDIQIPTGRRDGTVSEVTNVRPNMVDTGFTVDDLMKIFTSKGLSLEDLVILSGAHTIGSARCTIFNNRFQTDSTGNLTFVDSNLDKDYAEKLAKKCASGTASTTTVHIDPQTSFSFDNQYYNNLVAHRGLFQSDSNLFQDPRTRDMVMKLATDMDSFYQGWSESFVKLSSIGVKTEEGEIRQTCSRTNL